MARYLQITRHIRITIPIRILRVRTVVYFTINLPYLIIYNHLVNIMSIIMMIIPIAFKLMSSQMLCVLYSYTRNHRRPLIKIQ